MQPCIGPGERVLSRFGLVRSTRPTEKVNGKLYATVKRETSNGLHDRDPAGREDIQIDGNRYAVSGSGIPGK
jgi:hypothetical protein